jgi:hypothetical protein
MTSGPSWCCRAQHCSRRSAAPGSVGSLARPQQTMPVRIARDELRRMRELTQAIKALEAEI